MAVRHLSVTTKNTPAAQVRRRHECDEHTMTHVAWNILRSRVVATHAYAEWTLK